MERVLPPAPAHLHTSVHLRLPAVPELNLMQFVAAMLGQWRPAFLFALAVWMIGDDPKWSRAEEPVVNPSEALVTRREPLSLDEALKAFETSPDVTIELAASEPATIDPVSIRFDRQGRLWVVEMRDYPTGPVGDAGPQSRIRILRDNDHDGVFESASDFATGLIFPTGVQPWRDGVIVTLAGRIAYLADIDGDDVCDHEETWFTGFAEDNTQLRANHPVLASNGYVYVASGLRGGTIESNDPRWPNPDAPVRLIKSDFYFDPNGGEWGAVSGDSQHGLIVDDFGQRTGVSNRNPAKRAILPLQLTQHDPWLTPAECVVDLCASGPDSRVRPIANAWTTSNLHAGQFSAACGVHQVFATQLPQAWQTSFLTCEPTGSLVQRASVDHSGAWPKGTAVHNPGEAIASSDTWFRPVDIVDGPDGCLYVVDMHRAVIEHPQWVPEELKKRVDERFGDQQGRIYRIRGRGADQLAETSASSVADTTMDWTKPTVAQVVDMLNHPNRWQRDEATRWLIEFTHRPTANGHVVNDEATREVASQLLEGFPELHSAAGLARAALLLSRLNALSRDALQRLATSDSPECRGLAARLAVIHKNEDTVAANLLEDASPSVRLQSAIALASVDRSLATSTIDRLAGLAPDSSNQAPLALALGAVADENVEPVVAALLHKSDSGAAVGLKRLVRRLAMQPDARPIWLHGNTSLAIASAEAWLEGLRRARQDPRRWSAELEQADRERWLQLVEQAGSLASSLEVEPTVRVAVIRLMSVEPESSLTKIREIRGSSVESAVRMAAMETCASLDFDEHLKWLSDHVSQLPWDLATAGVRLAIGRTNGQSWVLDQLAEKRIARSLISPADAQRLLKSKDAGVVTKAVGVFETLGADRAGVIKKYSEHLSRGNATHGRELFTKHCSACHRIDDVGHVVGPDISDSRTQTPESLLTSILDPSRAIDAGFVHYQVLTAEGRVIDGLLESDRPEGVTLRVAGGEAVSVTRDQIEELVVSGVSLMPEGFEQLMNPAEMADLISYLKNWRYLGSTAKSATGEPSGG